MEYDIYLDVFFFVNFILNFLLLAGCGRILSVRFCVKRFLTAAAVGAGLSALFLLSGKTVPGGRILTAVLMGRLAYGKTGVKQVILRGMTIFFCAFVLAGAVECFLPSLQKISSTGKVDGKGLLFLLLLFGLLFFFFGERWIDERKKEELLLPVCLRWKGKEKRLIGLFDTGNQLVEPISGRPVHIAEYEAVRELMPESYQKAVKNYMETGTLDLAEVTRFQMYEFTFLTYCSIGQEKGQLLGIRMDSAVFYTRTGEKTEDKVVIGLSNQKLSGEGRYQMIINRRLGV
jgi:stage II sporulation protein GA (sporulation sigma-E factor processing peptidase)